MTDKPKIVTFFESFMYFFWPIFIVAPLLAIAYVLLPEQRAKDLELIQSIWESIVNFVSNLI